MTSSTLSVLGSYRAMDELVVPKSMPIDGALSLILVVALEGGIYLIGVAFVQGGGTPYVREQEGDGGRVGRFPACFLGHFFCSLSPRVSNRDAPRFDVPPKLPFPSRFDNSRYIGYSEPLSHNRRPGRQPGIRRE